MASPEPPDQEKLLSEYLGSNSIMIVDSVSSARVSLAATLSKLGGMRNKMSLVGSLEEAKIEIQKSKPKIIFSDFMIGKESGLDLIQNQKAEYDQEKITDSLFVLVTGNASQSTVARAAEEDVDTFVIKPYTMNAIKGALAQSVKTKLHPSLYLQLIQQGKERLFETKYDEAITFFEKAMKEHPEPTLACFYYGQAEFMKSAMSLAKDKYDEGLSFNKIHYKCLVGLFDLLNLQKKYHEAYDVIKRLAQYFPANPKRLTQVLRLAIITENFQDMEGYYRIYLKITERTEELVKYMCSALVVTGKFYLRNKFRPRAIEVFENAAVSAGGKTLFLQYIIENLVEYKMKEDGYRFLERLQSLDPAGAEFQACQFLLSTLDKPLIDSVQMGRNLIKQGIEFASVYEKLIMQSMKANYVDAADNLFQFAMSRWPDKHEAFTIARSHTPVPSTQKVV